MSSNNPTVAFVELSNNFYDKHPVYCLSSYLKVKGIDVSYINERNTGKRLAKIKSIKPDLLLYSAFSVEVQAYKEFDRLVKDEIGTKSVIGGAGSTFGDGILENSTIDAMCIGEGEYALEEYISNGFVPSRNMICKGDQPPSDFHQLIDLDQMPIPERDIVYNSDTEVRTMESKQFLAGRGCPYQCTYCFNHTFNKMFRSCGKAIRKKSVDYLIEEINSIRKKFPFKTAVFQDDTFIIGKKWLHEFYDRFPKEVNIPYTCNIRANVIDEDTVKVLKESGCVCVNWSIESGNDYLRNKVLKRNMSREQILNTGRLLKKYKMPNRIGNVIGLPGESYQEMLETLELNIKVKPTLALANIFVPFPSLDLTNYAIDNGYLSKDVLANLPKNFFQKSVLNFTEEEKDNMVKVLYLFPIVVKIPGLYNNKLIRRLIFSLPKIVLNSIYQVFYVVNLARLYKVRPSLKSSVNLFVKYIKDS